MYIPSWMPAHPIPSLSPFSPFQLRTRVAEYDALSGKLQVTPVSAKYSAGIDFGLCVDEAFLSSVGPAGALISAEALAMYGGLDESLCGSSGVASGSASGGVGACTATSSALLGNDIKSVIKAGLREMRTRFGKHAAEAAKQASEAIDALSRASESAKDARRRNELLERQLRDRNNAVETHRVELSSGLTGTEARVARLQAEITTTRNGLVVAASAARELSPEVISGLARQTDAHLSTLARQRAHTSSVVARVMNGVLLHKGGIDDKLKALAAQISARAETYAKRPSLGGSSVHTNARRGGTASGADAAGLNISFAPAAGVAARNSSAATRASSVGGGRQRAAPVATSDSEGEELSLTMRGGRAPASRASLTMDKPGSLAELIAAER